MIEERKELAKAWPLFALSLRTPRLEMRLPTDRELTLLQDVVQRDGIHPPDYMPFAHPWTKVQPPQFERQFMQHHWNQRATWSPERWWLMLAIYVEGNPVGIQDIIASDFAHLRTVKTASWISMAHQGQGLGTEARAAVLEFAFSGLGSRYAETSSRDDNLSSLGVTRKLGYVQTGESEAAPEGIPRRQLIYRIDREAWSNHRTFNTEIFGLDTCIDMFGS